MTMDRLDPSPPFDHDHPPHKKYSTLLLESLTVQLGLARHRSDGLIQD